MIPGSIGGDAEAKAAGADKEIEGLKEAGEQLRTELANVKTELESTKGENASLAQQVEGLSENLREVEGERALQHSKTLFKKH